MEPVKVGSKNLEKEAKHEKKHEPPPPPPPDGTDVWDDSLLPPELIDEVWKEQFSPAHSSASSVESYDFITESGTVIKLFRKRTGEDDLDEDFDEEETQLVKIPSLPDVVGGIPKSRLKQMAIEEIEAALEELEDAMDFILAENVIFERTIGRMEQRDREIEAAMPIFTYKYPWEVESDKISRPSSASDSTPTCPDDGESGESLNFGGTEEEEEEEEEEIEVKRKERKKTRKVNPVIGPDGKIREICDWEDSSDEEFNGDYQPIEPFKEISVSKDQFFDGMPIQDKYAIRMYNRSFGELAPANYDYMRHKYHELIGNQISESTDNEQIKDNYDEEIRDHQKIFDEVEGLGDEDPDFPGFFPRSAKRLPLEYKYKYAEEEDEILARDITREQTNSYRKENSIQVLIDTNTDAFELLSNLNEEFSEVLKHAYHPLTKRLMAEKILQFRKTIRNKILAEETKITMSLVELQKVRKKVNEQLRTQQKMGFKLQKIDFEQIRILCNEYTNRIDKAHTELKGLKLLTAGCFQILKEQRQKLNKKIKLHARMVEDIELRETLMIAFQADLQKYTQIVNEVQQRNNFMRKRIRAFKVPNSMEYIRFKAILFQLEEEVNSMRKRLRSMELNKGTQQLNLETLAKGLPISSLKSLNENNEWLEEMKTDVEEKGLLSILTEDELNNVHPEKKKRQLGETTMVRNYLFSRKSPAKNKQIIPSPKHVRDLYDPEEDQKSTTDVVKIQNNRSRQKRQTFNRLYENKPKQMEGDEARQRDDKESRLHRKCKDIRYRRGVKGNIIVDERDQSKISHLAKC